MNDNLNPDVSSRQTPKSVINEMSVLAPLLAIYTAGYMGLMTVDFLFKNQLNLPPGLMPIYMALLGAYAADKEIRRWVGQPEPQRRGTVFVYLWCLLYLVFFTVCFFRREFTLPEEMAGVTLRVLGIFFGSKTSKYIHEGFLSKTALVPDYQLSAVLALFDGRERLARQDIVEQLKVSASTANRLLEELERQGKIRREGIDRATVYLKN